MSHADEPLALTFPSLVRRWIEAPGSEGGWWALAGFSFQAAVYLETFFRGLRANDVEPAQLAEFERLSDVFAPDNGNYRLIQVKLTLRPDDLRSAVREAYRIASNCDPELLKRLRFQIACRKRITSQNPSDILHTDVPRLKAEVGLWKRMLAQFDPKSPIIEVPDPIDRLHYLLWECGVQDTLGFLDECRGMLLGTFEHRDASGIANLARRLAHLFRQTVRADKKAARLGRLLCREDLAAGPDAESDRDVVFQSVPSYNDLRLDRFRCRDSIFRELIARFDSWWAGVQGDSRAKYLPIFWIDGRSGEGKSVLLLQLAQHLLARAPSTGIVGSLAPKRVPDWIASLATAESERRTPPQQSILGLVDDLHSTSDFESWDRRLREAMSDSVPRVALLTCGPTTERRAFERACTPRVNVTPFTVPNLDETEAEGAIAWFQARTGTEAPKGVTGAANRPLAVLMFQLARGQSLGDFAKNFRERLDVQGMFGVAREILAANALELVAPLHVVDQLADPQRDYFAQLCDPSQSHFERVTRGNLERFSGYRFAHSQIGWSMYQEWAPHHATLARAWARDLAALLARDRSSGGGLDFAVAVVTRLRDTGRLSEAQGHFMVGSTQDALAELFHKCGSDLQESLLPQWLECLYRWSDLVLTPDPVQLALDARGGPLIQPPQPAAAGWYWRLSETARFTGRAEEMRQQARWLVFSDPTHPGTGSSLALIATQSLDQAAAMRLVKDWLERYGGIANAYPVLAVLVARHSTDIEIYTRALAWVEAYPTHEKASELLVSLVANRREDEDVRSEALAWVRANPTHDRAYRLLSAQVANRPKDDESIVSAALAWIKSNLKHRQAYQLLAALANSRPNDADVLEAALDWIDANSNHDKLYWLYNALVANWHEDGGVRDAALSWVAGDPTHDDANQLLAALVTHWPNDAQVMSLARSWWRSNLTNPNRYVLLCPLITRSDGASEWMLAGETLLADDEAPGEANVLAALLSGGKGAPKYLDMALSRLERVDYRARSFIRYQLARCLANNVLAAVDFLRGTDDTDRTKLIAKSLAIGLSRYPNRAEEFVEHISTVPTEYQGLLLAGCIRSEMLGAILDCVIEGWLAANHRRRGYGEVLFALTRSPARWQALLERNGLSSNIIADFDAQHGASDGPIEVSAMTTVADGSDKVKRRNARKRQRANPSSQ